jgi:hypothetical protein
LVVEVLSEPFRAMRRRPLFAWITALTAVGLLGTLVDFVGFFPANGGLRVGCGGLAGVLFFGLMFILILLGSIAGLALGGLNLYWRRSQWGPTLLIAANLLVLGFFGWLRPVNPGQLAWGLTILALATAPAAAIILLLWPLLTMGSVRSRLVHIFLVAALGVPLTLYAGSGLAEDLSNALQAPLPIVATSCGAA